MVPELSWLSAINDDTLDELLLGWVLVVDEIDLNVTCVVVSLQLRRKVLAVDSVVEQYIGTFQLESADHLVEIGLTFSDGFLEKVVIQPLATGLVHVHARVLDAGSVGTDLVGGALGAGVDRLGVWYDGSVLDGQAAKFAVHVIGTALEAVCTLDVVGADLPLDAVVVREVLDLRLVGAGLIQDTAHSGETRQGHSGHGEDGETLHDVISRSSRSV